jgi:hypothetical protein
MDDILLLSPSFFSLVIKPRETKRVTVPEGIVWSITSVSIHPTNGQFPTEGRVVLYASTAPNRSNVAIAPLTVGSAEVVNVELDVNSACPVTFTTGGSNIAVSINGCRSMAVNLKVETV